MKIISKQPGGSFYEEILKELAFAEMIEKGLEDPKANRTISHEEMKNK